MDISGLKRDRTAVMKDLKTAGDVVVTQSGCVIHTPARFVTRGLGDIGANTQAFGFFAIIKDDRYAVLNASTMIATRPSSISIVDVNGMDYYEYTYDPGATVIANRNTVMQDTVVYYIFNELLAKGYVPWYANIEDLCKIYVTAGRYAGANILDSNVVIEMVVSQIVRQASDKTQLYRTQIKDIRNAPPSQYTTVPLRSPIYGANNTTARFMGARFDDSLMTALVNPSDRIEPIEALLKN